MEAVARKDIRRAYHTAWTRMDRARYPEKYRARQAKYRAGNREAVRQYRLTDKAKSTVMVRRYGITLEDYLRLWESQEGQCAMCDKPMEGVPHVEHDHKNGTVRGLVHPGCNHIIASIENPLYSKALVFLGRREA